MFAKRLCSPKKSFFCWGWSNSTLSVYLKSRAAKKGCFDSKESNPHWVNNRWFKLRSKERKLNEKKKKLFRVLKKKTRNSGNASQLISLKWATDYGKLKKSGQHLYKLNKVWQTFNQFSKLKIKILHHFLKAHKWELFKLWWPAPVVWGCKRANSFLV